MIKLNGQKSIVKQQDGFCESAFKCPLPDSDKVHFDPYVGWCLCENFNPKQADFSKAYLKLQTASFKNHIDRLREYLKL